MGNKTDIDLADRLHHEHIASAADWAAEQLAATGIARVRLTPGDMTEYPILVAAPGAEWDSHGVEPGIHYWVALCASYGAGYPWAGPTGGDVHAAYAADKWVNRGASEGTRMWAGTAMALFLTALGGVVRADERRGPA